MALEVPCIRFTASLPEYLKYKEREDTITETVVKILSIVFPPLHFYDLLKKQIHLLAGQCLIDQLRNPSCIPIGLQGYKNFDSVKLLLTTPDGIVLEGQFIPSNRFNERSKTIIIFNGNGEKYECKLIETAFRHEENSIMIRYDNIANFFYAGHDVIVFNYRGVKNSEGHVSCKGLKLDAETVYQFVSHYLKVPDEKIVLFGQSFGGAIATHLAKWHPVKLFNVRSFSSLKAIVQHYATIISAFVLEGLDWIFNAEEDWKEVKGEKWVVYHKHDQMIPEKQSFNKAVSDPRAIKLKDEEEYFDELCLPIIAEKRSAFKEALKKARKMDAHNRCLTPDEISQVLFYIKS